MMDNDVAIGLHLMFVRQMSFHCTYLRNKGLNLGDKWFGLQDNSKSGFSISFLFGSVQDWN